jgi:hypothetical protein
MRTARLWRDQGKREEACELLAPVYGWFTEGIDARENVIKQQTASSADCAGIPWPRPNRFHDIANTHRRGGAHASIARLRATTFAHRRL